MVVEVQMGDHWKDLQVGRGKDLSDHQVHHNFPWFCLEEDQNKQGLDLLDLLAVH
jgi:hypothetical protein